jgi:hypothetical protein
MLSNIRWRIRGSRSSLLSHEPLGCHGDGKAAWVVEDRGPALNWFVGTTSKASAHYSRLDFVGEQLGSGSDTYVMC